MLKTIIVQKFNYKEMEGKKGKFYKIGIKTVDKNGQEVWVNGLADGIPQWKDGEQIELDITMHEQYGLQFPFLNVAPQTAAPQSSGVTREEFEELKRKVEWLTAGRKVEVQAEQVAEKYGGTLAPMPEPELPPMPTLPPFPGSKEDDIKVEDIPW